MKKNIGLGKYGTQLENDINISIRVISNKNNDKPKLLITETNGDDNLLNTYLCDKIMVGNNEYFAQYIVSEWERENSVIIDDNKMVKLPNGEVISEYDFTRRFWSENEILI